MAISDEIIQKIRGMRAQGYHLANIGRRTGLTLNAVNKICARYKIPKRTVSNFVDSRYPPTIMKSRQINAIYAKFGYYRSLAFEPMTRLAFDPNDLLT